MNLLVAFIYASSVFRLVTPTWNDQAKAFEEAVKEAQPVKSASAIGTPFSSRIPTVEELNSLIQQGASGDSLEMVVNQLMAAYPSENVRKLGEDFIQALDADRKDKADAFAAQANNVLGKVPDIVVHAQKAADLDDVLKELKSLQDDQESAGGSVSNPSLVEKIGGTFQFVTLWQDYLAASAAGNAQEAKNTLREILNNRQLNAPTFFPRSQILTLLYGTGEVSLPSLPSNDPGKAVDAILGKVQKIEDLDDAINQIHAIPNLNWDFSCLINLMNAHADVAAGLPVTLDLKALMNGGVFGDDISRIDAMGLLSILPRYFGTEISHPPKTGELLGDYLDRLIATASSEDNLALLQRVLAVKIAIGTARSQNTGSGSNNFLAGLTQDADGQYAPAVISYENALKDPDLFLPISIVGERLAAIRTAHPDDFKQGMDTFLASETDNPYMRPGMPMMPPFMYNKLGRGFNSPNYVLPIPMTISIPSAPTTTSTPTK